MAIEGSLADVSLADICQLLALGRKTGCLTVTDRSNFGYIYFRDGRVVYASVLNRPDRLGDILVKNGVVQPDQFARAMEEQGRDGQRRLGEILVEFGALSAEELEKWVTVQVEEAVYHLFSWNQGSFHFKPDELPDEDQVLVVSLNADGLLLEGARRVDEWSLIEKEIHSLDLIFKATRYPEDGDGVELTGNQRKLLPLLDGNRTVREVIDEFGLVEFQTGKAIYELVRAGFAKNVGEKTGDHVGDDGESFQEHVRLGHAFYRAGMLEDAAEEFAMALEANPAEPISLFQLGLIRLRGGESERALELFDAIPQDWARIAVVLRNRALALERLGRFEEALGTLRQAERKEPGNSGVLLARGIAELKGGDPASARKSFLAYRTKAGKDAPPSMYYAFAVLAAAQSGHLDEAVAMGREGLKEYPTEASILVNTGAILDHKGDHEAAEQYFIRALSSGSEVPPRPTRIWGTRRFGGVT